MHCTLGYNRTMSKQTKARLQSHMLQKQEVSLNKTDTTNQVDEVAPSPKGDQMWKQMVKMRWV